ncbi:hypothetical protein R54876_GBNLAHCA_00983 [Eupransor demetentiae]|uniref:Uncharacterized protein n=1 Tax=Eupransor demetentiae TaxID=3109584 RepID=A0ABM9N5J2_9LACO|nr:hypothetical protein R54876_GBNLAHCA_00983 [Lactobacillaceae bacterium LMG 33000]
MLSGPIKKHQAGWRDAFVLTKLSQFTKGGVAD